MLEILQKVLQFSYRSQRETRNSWKFWGKKRKCLFISLFPSSSNEKISSYFLRTLCKAKIFFNIQQIENFAGNSGWIKESQISLINDSLKSS